MIYWSAALLLMALGGAPDGDSGPAPIAYAQLTVRQQIIVRVPAPQAPRSPAPPAEWAEGRGPRCVPSKSIAGATMLGRNSVDLVLRNNSRVRAKLEKSCPALDYYHGFYIQPNGDGMICADRDVIRSRMGGQCEIERFRSLTLVPSR